MGDLGKSEFEDLTGEKIKLVIKYMQDFRSYKVSTSRAHTELRFKPREIVRDLILDLYNHRNSYGDYEKEE